jgi:hypothetical protein
MTFADWIIVKQSLEEELALEKQIRTVENLEDLHTLQQLCSALTRQNWHHSKLLKQAVEHIASIDRI